MCRGTEPAGQVLPFVSKSTHRGSYDPACVNTRKRPNRSDAEERSYRRRSLHRNSRHHNTHPSLSRLCHPGP